MNGEQMKQGKQRKQGKQGTLLSCRATRLGKWKEGKKTRREKVKTVTVVCHSSIVELSVASFSFRGRERHTQTEEKQRGRFIKREERDVMFVILLV